MRRQVKWNNSKEREGGLRGSPIGGDDGVAADVDVFGFGLAVNFGKGRLVLLFLKDSTHSLICLDLFFLFFFLKKNPPSLKRDDNL